MTIPVITVDDTQEWSQIHSLLQRLKNGAIILGPVTVAAIRKTHGGNIPDEIRYNFDFEPDVVIDWTNDETLSHHAVTRVLAEMSADDDVCRYCGNPPGPGGCDGYCDCPD